MRPNLGPFDPGALWAAWRAAVLPPLLVVEDLRGWPEPCDWRPPERNEMAWLRQVVGCTCPAPLVRVTACHHLEVEHPEGQRCSRLASESARWN